MLVSSPNLDLSCELLLIFFFQKTIEKEIDHRETEIKRWQKLVHFDYFS